MESTRCYFPATNQYVRFPTKHLTDGGIDSNIIHEDINDFTEYMFYIKTDNMPEDIELKIIITKMIKKYYLPKHGKLTTYISTNAKIVPLSPSTFETYYNYLKGAPLSLYRAKCCRGIHTPYELIDGDYDNTLKRQMNRIAKLMQITDLSYMYIHISVSGMIWSLGQYNHRIACHLTIDNTYFIYIPMDILRVIRLSDYYRY